MADRWMIRGTEFTNCNCAWGCQCQFGAKSTHGHCETVMCGHIEEGNFNDAILDGLNWALLVYWPDQRCNSAHNLVPPPRSRLSSLECLSCFLAPISGMPDLRFREVKRLGLP